MIKTPKKDTIVDVEHEGKVLHACMCKYCYLYGMTRKVKIEEPNPNNPKRPKIKYKEEVVAKPGSIVAPIIKVIRDKYETLYYAQCPHSHISKTDPYEFVGATPKDCLKNWDNKMSFELKFPYDD